MMKFISKSSFVAVIVLLGTILLSTNACINCKHDTHSENSIEEPFDNKETSKLFFRTFHSDQKIYWAHHQETGERKADRRGIEPTDHNYNTLMLAVSKDLDKPYRAVYRTRSGNQKIWEDNNGTQHVKELEKKLRNEKSVIGRIKKVFPHKSQRPHVYQRINSKSPTSISQANLIKSKGKKPMQSKLSEHMNAIQSPRSREKVQEWLNQIPTKFEPVSESGPSSHKNKKEERIEGQSECHSRSSRCSGRKESADGSHGHMRSSYSPSRTYSQGGSSNVALSPLQAKRQTSSHSKKSY